jgi:hypothetical protein
MAVVVKDRTCRQCGAIFMGGPRAWYCPVCRTARAKQSKQRYLASGPSRPLGSIDYCKVCGNPYTVNSARQKYCPDCAYEAVRSVDRPASRAWNQAHKETYYPARNAARNAERAANPEAIRDKERAYREKQRKNKQS